MNKVGDCVHEVCVFVFVHACVTKWRTQSSKNEEGPREPGYLQAKLAHRVDTCVLWYADSTVYPA